MISIKRVGVLKSEDESIFHALRRVINNQYTTLRTFEVPMIHPPRPYKIVNNSVQGRDSRALWDLSE